MPLSLFAASPATPAPVLAHQTRHALDTGDTALLTVLAQNLSLAPADTARIAAAARTWVAAGQDVADVVTALVRRQQLSAYHAAQLACSFPEAVAAGLEVYGEPFALACGYLGTAGLVAVLETTSATAEVRLRAAHALAGSVEPALGVSESPDVLALADYLEDFPQEAGALVARMRRGREKEALKRRVAAQTTARVGSYLWLRHPDTGTRELVAHAGISQQRWEDVVANCREELCTQELATTALTAAVSPVVAHRIGSRDAFPLEVRLRALLDYAKWSATAELGGGAQGAVVLPEGVPMGWLEEYTASERAIPTLVSISGRSELSAGVLDNLVAGLQDTRIMDPATWFVWVVNVATHPDSQPHHREYGDSALRAVVAEAPGPAAALAGQVLAALPALRQTRSPGSGACLPVAVLRHWPLCALPGVGGRAAQYLDSGVLGAGAGPALTLLAGTFEGTLGELVRVAGAVSA